MGGKTRELGERARVAAAIGRRVPPPRLSRNINPMATKKPDNCTACARIAAALVAAMARPFYVSKAMA